MALISGEKGVLPGAGTTVPLLTVAALPADNHGRGVQMVGLCSFRIRPASWYLPVAVLTGSLMLGGCASAPPPPPSAPASPAAGLPAETDAARSIAQLRLRLLEQQIQNAELQKKLDDAIQEVIRANAQLQSVESRAQAASTLAEAEVALSTMDAAAPRPEITQAEELLQMSAAEFDNENYGGSLYLTTQAKSLIAVASEQVSGADRPALPGEEPFAVPLPLRAVTRTNVREGPGTEFEVLFVVSPNVALVGQTYKDPWVRIRDERGRTGWIFHSLIESRLQQGSR